jgi:hypothetical protein
MAQWERAPESIVWSSVAPRRGAESDLEWELRRFCNRGGRVTPDLARDVLFWLDLGREPRDVARWLREQLEVGEAARSPSVSLEDSLFPRDARIPEAGERIGWTRKRRRASRRGRRRRSFS